MPHFTTYSFCFDNLIKNNDIHTSELCNRLKALHPQLHSIYMSQSSQYNCITMTGSNAVISQAKSDIVNQRLIEITLSIHSLYPGLAYRKLARNRLHEQLKLIAMKHKVQITADYNQIKLTLIGSVDTVEMARIDVLIYIDNMLGFFSNSLKIPLYSTNILGSKRNMFITSIMEETGTNIYTSTTHPTLVASTTITDFESTVNITGNTVEAVQKATVLLEKALPQRIENMCNSCLKLKSRKRDWLLLYKRKEIEKIERDNGSYIVFSENTAIIQVFAENNINVQRTLRSLNYLTSHIFQAIIQVKEIQSADIAARLAQDSGAQVIYRTDFNQFEITGSKEQVRSAVQLMPIPQKHHKSVVFSIELALDQREFISGKKNGKINKIMKSCDVSIQFSLFNDFNFIINIESEDFFKAKNGLDSLQNELPAEISFFVPEICHRRIIGVEGKNIQRVMKQHGVYVKFSSDDDLTKFGGYFENEDNVVARTPEKNIASLEKFKQAVMEFITSSQHRDYITRIEYVPFYLQRTLLHLNGNYLTDKASSYSSRIIWPERNGTDHVLIKGPQSHIEETQSIIKNLLPQLVDFQVPASVVLENILESDEIEELIHEIYQKTGVFLILPDNLLPTNSSLPVSSTEEAALSERDLDQQLLADDLGLLKIEGKNTNNALFSPNDCRILTFKLCFDANTKNLVQKARQMFDSFMNNRYVPVDDTLHNNLFNGSPSPDDMHHISPSVMHHIDHPESYETSTKKLLNTHRDNSNFFQKMQQQTTKKIVGNGTLAHHTAKVSASRQPNSIDFFAMGSHSVPVMKRNMSTTTASAEYDQIVKNPMADAFSVWPNSQNDRNGLSKDSFQSYQSFPRSNQLYSSATTTAATATSPIKDSSNHQFYYPRPELKPNFSTSTINQRNNINSLLNYSGFYQPLLGDRRSGAIQQQQQQQQQRHQQADCLPSTSTGNSNAFAPIGYSRQRSTSLLPTIGHHQLYQPQQQPQPQPQQLHQMISLHGQPQTIDHKVNNSSDSAGINSFFAPPPVTSPMENTHDYYMSNSRFYYPIEKQSPSSSLSTPIPVGASSSTSSSLQSMNTPRFDQY